MKKYENILFKEVPGHGLYMDITVPEDVENPPILMWVHGGGWCELKRSWSLVNPLAEKGYAIASVDYRYSDECNIDGVEQDLKAALLFLKKHGAEYGCDSSKIAVSGDSAGAHLGTLMAISEGNKDWELEEGDYSVSAIIDISGPVSFTQMMPGPGEEAERGNPFEDLLGCPLTDKTVLPRAAKASAETYINGYEPPILIIHGSEDPIVERSQAIRFRNALEAAGDTVHMYLVPGGKHSMGGPMVEGIMAEFLDFYVKGIYTVTEPPVMPEDFRTLPGKKE